MRPARNCTYRGQRPKLDGAAAESSIKDGEAEQLDDQNHHIASSTKLDQTLPGHWTEDAMYKVGVVYLTLRRKNEILAAAPLLGQARNGRKSLLSFCIDGERHIGVRWYDSDDPQSRTYGLLRLSKCVQLRLGDLERYNIPHGQAIKISDISRVWGHESESLFRDELDTTLPKVTIH